MLRPTIALSKAAGRCSVTVCWLLRHGGGVCMPLVTRAGRPHCIGGLSRRSCETALGWTVSFSGMRSELRGCSLFPAFRCGEPGGGVGSGSQGGPMFCSPDGEGLGCLVIMDQRHDIVEHVAQAKAT
jgi:hypothetical protein